MGVKFRRIRIADETYESAAVFDVDNDGTPDIVSGAYWYEGPDFRKRHRIADIPAEGEYFDDFSTVPLDINGNGRLDYVSGGWFGKALRWYENPGRSDEEWRVHVVAETSNIETTRGWDVDGDGVIEIVPNTPSGPLTVYKLVTDAGGRGTGAFTAHTLFDGPQGHGLGFGDVSGSGRGDFVLAKGWLEAPADPLSGAWTWHPEFDLGSASVPVVVADVDGDGLSDLIVGQAHGYGLDWWQQRRAADGTRQWARHPIDPYCSQYHDMQWVDIDADGWPELVTGKRYRAHCGNDPGADDDVGIYYFKWTGQSFSKQVIDYGPGRMAGSTGGSPPPAETRGGERRGTGCGIHFAVADLNGNGRLDIVAPGKDGLVLFENLGAQ